MATESDNVNSGALGTLLAVGLFAVIGIAFVVTALVRAETAEEVEKKEVSADRPFRDLVADQTAKLNAPAAYVDRNKGLVSLPIDRAMELTVTGLKKDPNSATPPPPKDAKDAGAATADAAAADAGAADGAVAPSDNAQAPKEEEKPAEATDKDKAPGKEAEPKGEKKPEGDKPAPKPGKPSTTPVAPAPVAPAAPAPTAVSPAPHAQ